MRLLLWCILLGAASVAAAGIDRRALLLGLVLGAATTAEGWAEGYDSCDRLFPSHGVNNYGRAGTFTLVVQDWSTNASATSWTAGVPLRVTLSGGAALHRGYVAASFAGANPTSFSGVKAGGFVAIDALSRAMKWCDGGITQSSAVNKASTAWKWLPPPAGTGTVTLWSEVGYNFGGSNWEVRVTLPEAGGASSPPVPSASASASPLSSTCIWAFVSPPAAISASPSPATALAPTVTTTFHPDGLGGYVKLSSVINLSWRVLTASREITFWAWINQNVWMGFAVADAMNMTYPVAGTAYIGTTVDGQVSETVITSKNVVTGMHSSPVRMRDASSNLTGTNTSMTWTRAWDTKVCEDRAIDPYASSVGFIYAWGTKQAYSAHGVTNRGYARIKLTNIAPSPSPTASPSVSGTATPSNSGTPSPSVTGTPSMGASASSSATGTPTPSNSPTPTPTLSLTPTASASVSASASPTATVSITATPSASAVIGGGGSGSGSNNTLSGSVVLGDISVTWTVQPPPRRTVDFSMSAANRVYLSLARASSNSMVWPAAAVAVTGVPAASPGDAAGGQVLLYRMDGYDLTTFTEIPLAGSGVSNATVVFDGQRTTFNFSRSWDGIAAISGPSAGDLAVDPTAIQGWIYARGYTEALDGHEVFGYKLLRLQRPDSSSNGTSLCTPALCSYHGRCSTTGASLCDCDAGYTGDLCSDCSSLYTKSSLPGGNFSCEVRPASVRAEVRLHATADTFASAGCVGAAGSPQRANVTSLLLAQLAAAVGVAPSRMAVELTDAASGRRLAQAVPAMRALTATVQALQVDVSVGPSRNASDVTSPAAAAAIRAGAANATSAIAQIFAALGLSLDTAAAAGTDISYLGEAPAAICSSGSSGSSGDAAACTYPLSLALGDNMAIAWRLDSTAGLLHAQLAFTVPSVSQRRWFGIAFNSDESMLGGDGIAIEPGMPPGQEVNRYALNGYLSNQCPATVDETLVQDYSSFKEFRGPVDAATAAAYPALAAMTSLPAGAAGGTALTTVATFTRRLSVTPHLAAAAAAAGSRDLDASPDAAHAVWLTWAWGSQLTMGTHTAAMSGAIQLNLATGAVVPPLKLTWWVLSLHAAIGLAAVAVFLPLSAVAVSCSRRKLVAQVGAAAAAGPFASWRRDHAQAAGAAVLCMTVSFAVGIFMTPPSYAWITPHAKISLALFVLTLLLAAASSPVVTRAVSGMWGSGGRGSGGRGRSGRGRVRPASLRSLSRSLSAKGRDPGPFTPIASPTPLANTPAAATPYATADDAAAAVGADEVAMAPVVAVNPLSVSAKYYNNHYSNTTSTIATAAANAPEPRVVAPMLHTAVGTLLLLLGPAAAFTGLADARADALGWAAAALVFAVVGAYAVSQQLSLVLNKGGAAVGAGGSKPVTGAGGKPVHVKAAAPGINDSNDPVLVQPAAMAPAVTSMTVGNPGRSRVAALFAPPPLPLAHAQQQ